MTTFAIGPGIKARMDADQVNPASDELQILGARAEPQWAEACADDGSIYRWVRATNAVHRYPPGLPKIDDKGGGSLADKLQSVLDLGFAQGWKRYSGPVVGEPESMRWGDPGFDCSSFVSAMYRGALGIQLAAFTDTIADQTDVVALADVVPGDIILYRYNDVTQPNVRYPHVALWVSPGRMLDCQYPKGLGEHPILAHPFEVHRAHGL